MSRCYAPAIASHEKMCAGLSAKHNPGYQLPLGMVQTKSGCPEPDPRKVLSVDFCPGFLRESSRAAASFVSLTVLPRRRALSPLTLLNSMALRFKENCPHSIEYNSPRRIPVLTSSSRDRSRMRP